MNWLEGFPFRRRIISKENPYHFIPMIDFVPGGIQGADFYFTEEDGITKVDVETHYIEGKLYYDLPVGKPFYIYYKKGAK